MKFRPLVAAMTAGSLLFGSVGAFAQAEAAQERQQRAQDARERGEPGSYAPNAQVGRYAQPNAQRNERAYHREPSQDSRYDPRYYQRWDQSQSRYMPGDHFGGDWRGRGAGPNHDWYRGSYLPREYRGNNYVVDNWRGHHLYAPPAGYHWVQGPGGDYLLVAIATGLIASILLNQ
jgi:Ni/Co efflux regulator RcnB